MSIKGVKLKSESFFSISPGVLELWRKNLRGGGFRPPPPVQIGLSFPLRKGASFGSKGKVVSPILLLVESLMLESKTEELRLG